jgi:hypothetical protein
MLIQIRAARAFRGARFAKDLINVNRDGLAFDQARISEFGLNSS